MFIFKKIEYNLTTQILKIGFLLKLSLFLNIFLWIEKQLKNKKC